MSDTQEEAKLLCAIDFNAWLASLPPADWGDTFENSIPIHWDENLGEWLEGDSP